MVHWKAPRVLTKIIALLTLNVRSKKLTFPGVDKVMFLNAGKMSEGLTTYLTHIRTFTLAKNENLKGNSNRSC